MLALWMALACLTSASAATELTLDNQLKDHASPYLALHGDDPVAWQEWSADVLEMAQESGRLIYLSIGYFSCHWCHVLQQESFRNEDTAKVINASYIPVKIDRELEPALDARLMEFAQRIKGRGGWPLNVFLTPEGYPLYANFYMPVEPFRASLTKLDQVWQDRREELVSVAREEAGGSLPPAEGPFETARVSDFIAAFVAEAETMADNLSGGFGETAKFPSVPQLRLMLALQTHDPLPERKTFMVETLDAMANGGLRDHLDGGFFRYTVDPQWQTPHYEKMLYGNAQLARLYLRAATVLDVPRYLDVAADTLAFLLKRMRTEDGAFVAAFSAVDDNNVEGGSYLWTVSEIDSLLSVGERAVVEQMLGLGKDTAAEPLLPRITKHTAQAAAALGLDGQQVDNDLASAKHKLLAARRQRGLPVDDKILAGWNGLVLSAFAEAANAFDDPESRKRYTDVALQLADYLRDVLWVDGQLLRAVDRDGNAYGQPTIEDYAFVAEGFSLLHGDSGYQDFTIELLDAAWTRYYVNNGWRQTSNSLIPADGPRPLILDTALPSPSATLVNVMLSVGQCQDMPSATAERLRERALTALKQGEVFSEQIPFWSATQTLAMLRLLPAP